MNRIDLIKNRVQGQETGGLPDKFNFNNLIKYENSERYNAPLA